MGFHQGGAAAGVAMARGGVHMNLTLQVKKREWCERKLSTLLRLV